MNPVMTGVPGSVTVKPPELVAEPPGVKTVIDPELAPEGTVVEMELPKTVNCAATPLKLTLVVPERFWPLIVTEVPIGPLAGEKLERTGGGVAETVKASVVVKLPPGVITVRGALAAPTGTVTTRSTPEKPTRGVADTLPNKI